MTNTIKGDIKVGYTRTGKVVSKRDVESVGKYLFSDAVVYNLVMANRAFIEGRLTWLERIKLTNYIDYRSDYVGGYCFRPREFERLVLNPLGYRVRFRVELERLEDEG
jgi:hypothetical protein